MKNQSNSRPASAPLGASAAPATPRVRPEPRARTHEEISIRARNLWEGEGRPWGRDEEFWHRAERELREEDERRFANPDALLDPDGDPNDEVDQRLNDLARPRGDRSATSL